MANFKPWLWMPAQWSHALSPYAIAFYSLFQSSTIPVWKALQWRGLIFKNPLGLAGGVDKNGEHLHDWWKIGCGFIEVGTVTPEPQSANPGKIMDRDLATYSVWNRMGFPSVGMDEVYYNLLHLPEKLSPIFINVGKNRHTPNELAHFDYIKVMSRLANQADAFVINISSPNTKGLRDLQNHQALKDFLTPIISHCRQLQRPALVKLSPDMPIADFTATLQVCMDLDIDGYVLTNTTLARANPSPYPAEGGVSGLPLRDLSRECLKNTLKILGPQRKGKLIISVGGVLTSEEVLERLHMGADLVEIYSALIFSGPGFFRNVFKFFQKQQQGSAVASPNELKNEFKEESL